MIFNFFDFPRYLVPVSCNTFYKKSYFTLISKEKKSMIHCQDSA